MFWCIEHQVNHKEKESRVQHPCFAQFGHLAAQRGIPKFLVSKLKTFNYIPSTNQEAKYLRVEWEKEKREKAMRPVRPVVKP